MPHSRHRRLILSLVVALPVLGGASHDSPLGAQDKPSSGEASLPLGEILRLVRENEAANERPKPVPPVVASLTEVELQGRLLEESLELTAKLEVSVLAKDEWVSLPLFRLDDGLTVARLPRLDGATLGRREGELVLMTRKPGVYRFELGLLQRAALDGPRRQAVLDPAGATLARLKLDFDDQLFRLLSPGANHQADGVVLFPEDGRFEVVWEQLAPRRSAPEVAVERPPIDPVITSAFGSAVSTLEGRVVVRLLYALRLAGGQSLAFRLPPGQELSRVFVNGIAVPAAPEGGVVELGVEPARAGDQKGQVELVLSFESGGYHLSGDLVFVLPAPSWTINEHYLDLHLPQVFNYSWSGGSFSPREGSPSVDYTVQIPKPGKHLSFHQYLISKTTPTVRVGYTIDLADQYFGSPAGR